MSSNEVAALQRALNELRDEVHAWGDKIDLIHRAVLGMAGKVYVPSSASDRAVEEPG